MTTSTVPCPFVYAKGRKCPGYITHVEAYKCDVSWGQDADGNWRPHVQEVRSHYHLFCSERGSHAGIGLPDNGRMKFYLNELPDGLKLM
jgi:hypothetical protein